MRNLAVVVNRIMEKVPNNFANREKLEERLLDRVQSYMYTAPELLWLRWQEVGDILGQELGEPDTVWKQEIVDIFGDKK